MIDTHSHIYSAEFDDDRQDVMQRAMDAGVTHIVMPNENLVSVQRLLDTYNQWPDRISLALGLHPEEVHDNWADQLTRLEECFDRHPWTAIGEVGIDLYWDKTCRRQQMQALERQLGWCCDRDLPFIIHCREALDDILDVIDNLDCPVPAGVFHCFCETPADVDRIRRRGDFYFGVNGIATFKKSTVPALLPVIGLDRLLLETDSPYLAPVPNRGKRNESANIPHINAFVAQVLGVSPDAVSQATDRNVARLFGIELT